MDSTQRGTRDERILAALVAGEAATVEIAEATGVPERTVRAGLRHLRKEGLVVSPERGTYRLTGQGRRVAEDAAAAGSGPLRPAAAAESPAVGAVSASVDQAATESRPEPAGSGLAVALLGLAAIGAFVWAVVRGSEGGAPPPADPPSWSNPWSW